MNILVIPDVHLKPWMFERASEIMKTGAADRAVCLMDIPDDWGKETYLNLYGDTFDAAIRFQQDHPDTLWCYGNHDLSYVWMQNESGFSVYAIPVVQMKLRELQEAIPDGQLAYIHRIDNVLFMHGGLTDDFARTFVLEDDLIDMYMSMDADDAAAGAEGGSADGIAGGNAAGAAVGRKYRDMYNDTDYVIDKINRMGKAEIWNNDSPIWARPQLNADKMYRQDKLLQVVGHTPVDNIYRAENVVSCDVFSTYKDGSPIGTQEYLLIDTISWECRGIK